MIRVLIVEDSAVTRDYLLYVLGQEPALEVVGAARDGKEGVRLAEQLTPDVILMDVHMPGMDGLEATQRIMERVPTPIVMISASLKSQEVSMSFEALKAGALALVEKPGGFDEPGHEEDIRRIVETTKLMAEVKVVRRWPRGGKSAGPIRPPVRVTQPVRVVAVAASTGGPQALATILRGLPATCSLPILIVQHIAPGFVAGLVEWLGRECRLPVLQATPDATLRPGTVYVAPEGRQMGVTAAGSIRLNQDAGEDGFRPSATYLFRSLAEGFGPSAMGILLTGMGRDGAAGLLALRKAGGVTIAQNEATSVVFGMPGEAVRLGAAGHVMAPEQIAAVLGSL